MLSEMLTRRRVIVLQIQRVNNERYRDIITDVLQKFDYGTRVEIRNVQKHDIIKFSKRRKQYDVLWLRKKKTPLSIPMLYNFKKTHFVRLGIDGGR